MAGDQVGDDLGVGFRAELLAVGLEAPAQLGVVLDDPVEDDVDPVGAVAVRVGVLLGDATVRRPARVGDTGGGRRGGDGDAASVLVAVLDRGAQVDEVADRTNAVDLAVLDHRDPGRVIAAVLELLESGDQQVATRPPPDISDDSTHRGGD